MATQPLKAETMNKSTFTYKQVGDLAIKLDLYRPASSALLPVIVWIHGGALINGHREGISRRLLELASDSGYAMVSIDYRLAPETQLPQILADVEDAFVWIRQHGEDKLGVKTDKLAVAGGSAGGYLTLSTGHRVNPRPTVLVSYWGYGDLVGPWYSTPSPHPRHHRSTMTEQQARNQVNGPPVSDSRDRDGNGGAFYQFCRQTGRWPLEVSGWDPARQARRFYRYMPVRNVDRKYPPTMLIHGTADTDVPYEQSELMARQLDLHNIPVELAAISGAEHGLAGAAEEKIAAVYRQSMEFIDLWMK
jgi:acetyl esterase/lipase